MAAYIDLNPVRAGLVEDPAEYQWCGFGEAMTGSRRARRGICKALGLPQDSWESRVFSRYRCYLYEEGTVAEETQNPEGTKRKGFTKAQLAKVLTEESDQKRQPRLGQRIHSFSNGVAIGRKGFVEKFAEKYRDSLKRQQMRTPKKININGTDTGICVLKE